MIAFFPSLYRDELLYSTIARYHTRSGYSRQVSTFEDIYQNRLVVPSFEFLNPFTQDALSWMTKNNSFDHIVREHTMFPFYAHFLPLGKKKYAFDSLLHQEGNPSNYLGIKRSGKRCFRYCPKCAAEDRIQYGETFWHRSHQIQKINVCYQHGCYLIETDLPISSRQSPALYDAENIVPANSTSEDCSSIEFDFAQYVYSALSLPVSFVNADYGSFLHYHLDKKYINHRGIARDFTTLYANFSLFFKDMKVPEPWQVQKIFSGYLKDPYFICQIAFWEGVNPENLINNTMTHIDADTEQFYKKLSIKYSIDIDIISRIGDDICKHIYEKNRVHAKPGRRNFDYDSMDCDLLPKVKKYVKQLYSKEGRPEKLSFRKVEKALSLPPKRFTYLPRCKKYIEQHLESQNEFWAREVEWAVKELQYKNEPINWKHIHIRTCMRFCNLQSCYPYIKDSVIKQIVGNIIATLAPKDTIVK